MSRCHAHRPGERLPGDVRAWRGLTRGCHGHFPGDLSPLTHPANAYPEMSRRHAHRPGERLPGDVRATYHSLTRRMLTRGCHGESLCHHSLTRRMLPRGCHGESLCHHSLTRRMLPRGCHGESLCHHSLTRRMLPRGCHGESLCHHSLTRRMLPRGCHGESLCHHSLTRRMLPRGCHGESLCHHSLTRRMLTRGCHAITPTDPASVYPGMSRPFPGESLCHHSRIRGGHAVMPLPCFFNPSPIFLQSIPPNLLQSTHPLLHSIQSSLVYPAILPLPELINTRWLPSAGRQTGTDHLQSPHVNVKLAGLRHAV